MSAVSRIKSFPYPERIDSIESAESYLKSLYRSLTEDQVEKITDFEDMDMDEATVGELTIVTSINPSVDATVDLGAVGATDYRFRHLYLSGNLSDETNSLTVANAKTAYTHSQVAGGNSVHVSTAENTAWDAAKTHADIAGGNSVHVSTTENTNWDAAYSHIHNLTTDINHDALTNFTANEHFLQSAITTVGTIATGTWEGSSISTTYTDAKCTDATADNTAGNETSHATVVVDADFGSAGLCATNGSGTYSIVTDNSSTWNNAQAGDAGLTSLAGLVYASDSMIKVTATDTYAIRTMSEVRTDLGLVIGTNVLAYDAGLSNLAGIAMQADRYYYTSADNTHVAGTITAAGRAILDDANAAAQLTTLGAAGSGANSDITSMSGITGTIATPTNLTSKTTGAWSKTIGSGGDYNDWDTMEAAMPDLLSHAVTITLKTGTTLTEICDFKNKSATTGVTATIKSEKYYPEAAAIPTADGATATTLNDTDVFDTNDEYNNCWVLIVDGTGTDNGFVAITDTTGGATNTVTVSSWPGTEPDNTSKYVIVGALLDGSSETYTLDIRNTKVPTYIYGIGIKDGNHFGAYVDSCDYTVFESCGFYNCDRDGVYATNTNFINANYCGFVLNNTDNNANDGGMTCRGVQYASIYGCALSDNSQRGVFVRYGGFASISTNSGDNNGTWGVYAQESGQVLIAGAECSGSSGNHSDPGTADSQNADQAAAY